MPMIDQVRHPGSRAGPIVHHHRVEPRLRGRPVERHHMHPRKLIASKVTVIIRRRNYDHSVNPPA